MITETQQERDDEDIAIYIDELKSDDPNLKLNAVTKIISIAKILGPLRTRDELIPYLTEIIEECDNEDEFLIKLAEQIVELKHHVGSSDDIALLLTPLEFISSIEEPKIRDTSVKSIQNLVHDQNSAFFTEHVCPMVKRLIMWDNYTSKISGSALIPLCFKNVKKEEHNLLRSLVIELSKDDTPMVRRATAEILSELSEVYDQKDFDNEIKDMLYKFLGDDVDSVRMKALEQLPFLTAKIEQEERDTTLLDYPLGMDPERKNWRVRYHIPDALIGLCPHLSKGVIETKVLPFYEGLLKDTEHEVRSNALENLGSLARILCDNFNDRDLLSNMMGIAKDLIKDQSHHVRNSLIAVLSSNIEYLPEKFVQEDIPVLLLAMLQDDNNRVKLTCVLNLNKFYDCLGEETVQQKFIPELEKLVVDKNWKVRHSILKLNQNLFEHTDLSPELLKKALDLSMMLKDDHGFIIRETLTDTFASHYNDKTKEAMDSYIKELLTYWSGCNNYIFRVSVLKSLPKFAKVLDKKFFEELSTLVYTRLKDEKVFNVKINILRTVDTLYGMENRMIKRGLTNEVIGRFDPEEHHDFKFLIEDIREKISNS